MSLQDEAVGLLQQLLRLNTVNPPGNETIAAELLRDYLRGERRRGGALRARSRAGEPRRAPAAAATGRPLLPLPYRHGRRRCRRVVTRPMVRRPRRRPRLGARRAGHEEPGRGERRRDRVARAGGFQACRATSSSSPPRTRRSASNSACSGSATNIRTRCEWTTRSTKAAASGSSSAASAFYLCAAAEKMSAPFRLIVHGRSGHASMPGIADNALVKAAPLIEKLAAFRPEPSIGPEVAGFLDAVLRRAAAARRRARPPR